jgi:hypothetical protein
MTNCQTDPLVQKKLETISSKLFGICGKNGRYFLLGEYGPPESLKQIIIIAEKAPELEKNLLGRRN